MDVSHLQFAGPAVAVDESHSIVFHAGKKLAGQAVVDCLEHINDAAQFLPVLDAFLERGHYPSDVKAIVASGKKLGIDERLIYERLGQPLEQLAQLIRDNIQDPERFKRLIDKIQMIPPELLKELCERSLGDLNLCGMAALLAIDMGNAAGHVPEQFAADACGYKGIGGGMNLLKQWYDGRGKLTDSLRSHIKELARHALTELAFEWIAGGSGSSEGGLVPQTLTRPFRAGDELDQLDLEATLDSVISQGKLLDQITEDDLFVPIQSKGQAALCVLLDISGSMGGRELANCSISVVMLLGRLAPQEIAVRFLGAAHGRYNKPMAGYFHEALGGQLIRLRNLDAVPGLLMDAIRTS